MGHHFGVAYEFGRLVSIKHWYDDSFESCSSAGLAANGKDAAIFAECSSVSHSDAFPDQTRAVPLQLPWQVREYPNPLVVVASPILE